MAEKVSFGTIAKCEMKYAIIKVKTDNSIKFVTDVQFYPQKYCEWKDGQKAKLFEDKTYAEDICLGLNTNGNGCFVMEIPDFFDENDFTNPAKDSKE